MQKQKKFILVINAGSSSIKFKFFDYYTLKEIFSGICEKIKVDGNFKIKFDEKSLEIKHNFMNHKDAFEFLLFQLNELNLIKDLNEIACIGHRVVQGKNIKDCLKINEEILKTIESYIPLAPLHNSVQLETIKAIKKVLPKTNNYVVFDTSFHTSIPKINNYYAINKKWINDLDIKKYGFHGISYEYIVNEYKNITHKKNVNLIICHLGNGSSICCVKNNKSFDTSMGLSPNAGLIMGTRCGDIDFTILDYLIENTNLKIKDIIYDLNNNAGLKSICGNSDYREIIKNINKEDYLFAHQIFCQKVSNYIIQYLNYFNNKIDGIVFTGGIGENDSFVRKQIIDNIKLKKIILNKKNNEKNNFLITSKNSEINVYTIRTNEELIIAKKVKEIS